MKGKRSSRASGGKSPASGFYLVLVLLTAGCIGWMIYKSGTFVSEPEPPADIQTEFVPPPIVPASTSPPVEVPIVLEIKTNPPPAETNPVIVPPVTSLPTGTVDTTGLNLRNTHSVLEAQVALARQAICSGSIDGVMGSQTRSAIQAFQKREGIPVSGILDARTVARLYLEPPLLTNYTVMPEDLNRLQPVGKTWLAKSQQSALEYETILEMAAELAHAHPALIRQLNPGVAFSNLTAGATLTMPLVSYPPAVRRASTIRISLGGKTLEVFDANGRLLAHFPCSIASKVEKRPLGKLQVVTSAPNPNYTFNPEIFPESVEARQLKRKLIIPPGPNNPVGVAWIGLDLPGYGIHGTPKPEEVGRTESHGCFRLANWNAEYLIRMVSAGTPVYVEK